MADKLMYMPNDGWYGWTLNLMNQPIKIQLKSLKVESTNKEGDYYNKQLKVPSLPG